MNLELMIIIYKNIVVVNSEVKFIKGFFCWFLNYCMLEDKIKYYIGIGIILYGNNIILNFVYLRQFKNNNKMIFYWMRGFFLGFLS